MRTNQVMMANKKATQRQVKQAGISLFGELLRSVSNNSLNVTYGKFHGVASGWLAVLVLGVVLIVLIV